MVSERWVPWKALSKSVVRPGTCQGEHLDADALSREPKGHAQVTTCASEPILAKHLASWSQSSWIHDTEDASMEQVGT